MDPVMVRTADGDEILDGVRSTLRAAKDVMRIDRAVASDVGDKSLCSTSSISVEYLLTDVFRYAEALSFACRAA